MSLYISEELEHGGATIEQETTMTLTDEQRTALPTQVNTALDNAAEGGYDHTDDGMTDEEVADSLLSYDADISWLWEWLENDETNHNVDVYAELRVIVAGHVSTWRTARRAAR